MAFIFLQSYYEFMKVHYKKMPIKRKILFFNLAIVIIPLIILALFANRISTQAIINKAINNSISELVLIDKNLETLTNNIEDYSRILSTDFRLQNMMKEQKYDEMNSIRQIDIANTFSKVLSNFILPNTYVAAASIMTAEGALVDVGNVDNLSVYSVLTKDFVKYSLNKQTPVWTDLFSVKYHGNIREDVFAVAKSIIHKDTGDTIGIVFLYVKEKTIASIYNDERVKKKGKFFILNDRGYIISSQDKSNLYKNFEVLSYGYNGDTLKDRSYIIKSSDRKKLLLTVRTFKKLGWKVVDIVALDEITAENKGITMLIFIIYRISLSKGNDIITIGEEFQLIRSYLEIQKIRYIEYMDYEMHVEELGFKICGEAKNGKEALEKLQVIKPDIVLVDINMPIMDELELVEELKNREIDIMVVILTGYSEFSYAKKAVGLGVQNYLLKPIEEEELKKTLKNIKNMLEKEKK